MRLTKGQLDKKEDTIIKKFYLGLSIERSIVYL
jgi:hypothetical protein